MQKHPEAGETQPQPVPFMGMLGDAHVEERLRSLRDALRAAGQGDFSVRLPTNGGDEGLVGEVVIAFNVVMKRNRMLAREIERISRVVGNDGQLGERASLGPVSGA